MIAQEYAAEVPVSDLVEHPDNPRRGDTGLIADSIAHNGFYGAVIAQRATSRVLAGNHRLRAAVSEGLETLPVIWVDVICRRYQRLTGDKPIAAATGQPHDFDSD